MDTRFDVILQESSKYLKFFFLVSTWKCFLNENSIAKEIFKLKHRWIWNPYREPNANFLCYSLKYIQTLMQLSDLSGNQTKQINLNEPHIKNQRPKVTSRFAPINFNPFWFKFLVNDRNLRPATVFYSLNFLNHKTCLVRVMHLMFSALLTTVQCIQVYCVLLQPL